jgi:hypothetical protein
LPCAPVSSEIQISDKDFEAAHLNAQLRIKEQLEGLATRKLPSRIGDVYTEVVLACLRCLDPGNRVFGDKNENDKNGTIIGVRFLELILARINSISI